MRSFFGDRNRDKDASSSGERHRTLDGLDLKSDVTWEEQQDEPEECAVDAIRRASVALQQADPLARKMLERLGDSEREVRWADGGRDESPSIESV